MKSIAEQSLAELGGPISVLSRQKRDHIDLDRMLRKLAWLSPEEQPALMLKIYRLVFPHAFAEEAVLWPVIRRLLPDGHELTLRVEIEHQEINELVTRLESLDVRSPERQEVLDQMIGLLRADVRDEEDALLPRLQTKLTPTQLWLLGVAWEAVRRVSPTRAHPLVSRRPPGNVLSALPLSILDRSRDFVEARLQRGAGPVQAFLERVGSALRRASHFVERLPGLDRGEDLRTHIDQRSKPSLWPAVLTVAVVLGAAAAVLLTRRQRA